MDHMHMGFVTGFALLAALHIAAGVAGHLLHGKKRGHFLPLALTLLGLPVPHFLPAEPVGLRFLCALGAAMGLLRAIDLARDKTPRPILFRIQHLMMRSIPGGSSEGPRDFTFVRRSLRFSSVCSSSPRSMECAP